MKRYQIVNRPSDGLELRQLDETARHINELWARLTEFGEEFKKSTDTLTQAAGSLAGRVTVLENPPATEEPTDPEPTPPPIPTIVAAAAGGFINATVSTLEPVDSYDCQLQEEAVEDPPTEWQNAKYGTFSFIPPLPNTNYVVWARSRRAYLQSDWATSDVVNSGFLPYLLLDASNDPLTGTLEISLPPQPGQSYLESPALSIRYIHDMTAYDLFKIWDNSGGLGEGPWLSLGIWSGETGWPPSMPVFGYFNVDYGPKDGGVSATLETTDSSGNQTGRISFYDSGKAFVNKDGDSLFQHGVFENSINVTGTGDYSCAVYIAEYSGNAAIEYYYYTTSWLKYAYQNVSGFFIDWTNYDEPGFWIGDTAWRDGLWLQADGFSLSNYSGSEFGSSNENAWINSGSLTLYSFSADTPPFVLSGNNTGVLVTGLNADLLDGYHASAFALDGHNHDHGALAGLADDDHPQYMLRSDLGSGTDNYIPKFLVGATPTFADSIMSQTGTTAINLLCSDAVTNTATDILVLQHDSSSTPAAGFGSSILWQLDSDTQEDRDAAEMTVSWTTATDATRTSKVEIFQQYNATTVPVFHQSGINNIFIGRSAGNTSVSGGVGRNVAVGVTALAALTTGNYNMAIGYGALGTCTQGGYSVAIGYAALNQVKTTNYNVAIGDSAALYVTGSENTCIGTSALNNQTTGSYNVAIGRSALVGTSGATVSGSTAIGYGAGLSSQSNTYCVFIGHKAGYYETASSKLFIDNAQRASEADGRIKALIYGIFASTNAAQYLTINGNFINQIESTDTNAVRTIATLRHNTTGVVANGLGTGLAFQIETSTTENTDAARISSAWVDSTHATRKANMILSVYDTAIRTGLTIAATGSGAALTADGTLTVGADDTGYDVTFYGATSGKKLLWDESADTLQVDGAFDLNGGATLGGADTDLLTCVGRLIVRTVADGDMDATAGTVAEVVFNSADSKFYGCTVSGSPATWAALN